MECGSGGPECIVGDSLGGVFILEMLSQQRLKGVPVVLSGCPHAGLPWWVAPARIPGAVNTGLRLLQNSPTAWRRPILHSLLQLTVSSRSVDLEPLEWSVLHTDPRTAETLLRYLWSLGRKRWEVPSNIPAVLIVRGANDLLVGQHDSQELARRLHAKYLEISEAGHTPMLESPGEYAACIRMMISSSRPS